MMQSLILECAVRAFLIAICMGAVLLTLRVKAARVRHTVWVGVVILMLALPVWTAWGPKAAVAQPILAEAAFQAASLASVTTPQASEPSPVRSQPWTWQNYLACVYLTGLCLLLARLAIGTVRAHMLVRRAVKREGRLTSDACAAPVTIGWLNPRVILPEDWPRWPQAQLSAVLTHEGEHARWRDPLVQWLALLNRAIFWFHPLAWWLERRLSALAEEACDAAVLARGHDRFEYSECLLQMARAMQQSGSRGAIGMAMPGPFLPQRIRRILEGAPAQRISRLRLVSVAMACAVVSAVFTIGMIDRAQAQATAAPEPAPAQARPSPANPSPSAPNPRPQIGGTISGTVEDPSGSRVPNCIVVLHNQSGDSVETARSDATGIYRFTPFPPGRYTLDYTMPGFARQTMQAEIEAGKPARVDAKLEVGKISSTVTVVGQKPAPSATRATPEPGVISVGGKVDVARLLRQRQPVYPPELLEQGIEGTVRLAAIISRDGVPEELRVLNTDRIDSRFTEAALEAVRQWRYQPTKLNGQPIPVATTIDVTFALEK